MTTTPSNNPFRGQTMLLSMLVAAIFLAILWFLAGFQDRSQMAASPSPQPETSEPWPTREPILTPVVIPTVTLVPTQQPTPSPVPTIIKISEERIGRLESFAVTMSTVRVERKDVWQVAGFTLPFGRDTISVEYYARVTLGIQYKDIEFSPNGSSVVVKIPKAQILNVEPLWDRLRIIDSDPALFNSKIPQTTTEAWKQADAQIRNAVETDSELKDLAQHYAGLLVKDQLRELGFEHIEIQYK